MTLDETVESMKIKAEEMARYYFEGFKGQLQGIVGQAEMYISGMKDKQLNHDPDVVARFRGEKLESANRYLQHIKERYEQIPFDQLHGREEFYPLFIVARMLPTLETYLNWTIFSSSENDFDRLRQFAKSIGNVGELYRESFKQLMERIRAVPGNENYKVKVIDFKGEEWDLSFSS